MTFNFSRTTLAPVFGLTLLQGLRVQAQAPACTANPVPGCLCTPVAFYGVDRSESQVVYTDIAGLPRCDEVAQVLRATLIGFLDGHVLSRPLALQWLARRDVEIATGSAAQWLRR